MSKLAPPLSKRDHTSGSPDAPIEFLEYGDFQCPYCRAAYPIVKRIQEAFGKDLLFAFRNFPLTNAHPYAFDAAIAAEAAGKKGKYWEMHDILYEKQDQFGPHAFVQFAREIGLDVADFKGAVKDEALQQKVEADFESGMRSGVNGTPSFFINGYKFEGSYDYQSLHKALERVMEGSNKFK